MSLVDAKEFEGGGEGNNDTNDDTNALVGNIEGLNPKGVKRIVVDGEEETSNVFVVTKPGVYSTLITSKDEEGTRNRFP